MKCIFLALEEMSCSKYKTVILFYPDLMTKRNLQITPHLGLSNPADFWEKTIFRHMADTADNLVEEKGLFCHKRAVSLHL